MKWHESNVISFKIEVGEWHVLLKPFLITHNPTKCLQRAETQASYTFHAPWDQIEFQRAPSNLTVLSVTYPTAAGSTAAGASEAYRLVRSVRSFHSFIRRALSQGGSTPTEVCTVTYTRRGSYGAFSLGERIETVSTSEGERCRRRW